MKKLTEIIVEYSKKYVNENNDWYNWREINEDKLPMGIELPKGNQYLKNVVLKKELNKKWKESQNVEDKLILIKYYIATWGGIHTNSLESMEEYSKLSASQLIKNGKKGIASWSKAIVVHDPNEFAIFDARVAISLNCIQKLYGLNDAVLFPVLPSRNKIVALGNKLIKATAKSESWEKVYEENFDAQYLKILNYAAKSEELVQDAYPNSLN